MQPYAGNNPQNSSAPQKAPDLALCLQPPFRNLNNLLYLPHTCKGTQAKGDFSGCNTHMAEEVVASLLSCVSGLCPSWRHRGLISRIVWFKSGACKGNVGWCFKCLLSLSLSLFVPPSWWVSNKRAARYWALPSTISSARQSVMNSPAQWLPTRPVQSLCHCWRPAQLGNKVRREFSAAITVLNCNEGAASCQCSDTMCIKHFINTTCYQSVPLLLLVTHFLLLFNPRHE